MRVSMIVFLAVSGAISVCIAIACGGGGKRKATNASQAIIDPTSAMASNAPAPKSSEVNWAHPSKAVILGDLQVQILRTTVGPVRLKEFLGSETPSEGTHLAVHLQLLNRNATRKFDYKSWGSPLNIDPSAVLPGRGGVLLRDNYGNNYKRANFGLGSFPVGAIGQEASIYPGKMLTDVIAFEPPIEAAKELDLELPGKNFGQDGYIRFRIPIGTVTKVQ